MSVFKYVAADGLRRFLSTWALRITPPVEFNDPFEMRARFFATSCEEAREWVPLELRKKMEEDIREQVAAANSDLSDAKIKSTVKYLMGDLNSDDETVLLCELAANRGHGAVDQLRSAKEGMALALDAMWIQVDSQIPNFNNVAESALLDSVHKSVGVLCLSGSGKHPLMWSHYADNHHGALLEFDERHATFNRKRTVEDDMGSLRRVWYSDTRPHITSERLDDIFPLLALTKALEWAYEQEFRMLWPLSQADNKINVGDGSIYLIDVPPSALRSITIGCKALPSLIDEVKASLTSRADASHIKLKQAVMDRDAFLLNYELIG